MRTIILSLKDAVTNGLKDIDLLDRQDKVIFIYLKGQDSISIAVHNSLMQLKCQTEFYEVPDEAATDADLLMYAGYLAGCNREATVIDYGSIFAKLAYLNIPRYPDFKSVISGKSIKKSAAAEPVRTRKPRTVTRKDAESSETGLPEKTEEKKKPKVSKTPATGKSIDDLKIFLSNCATTDCDPSKITMSIYESVKKNITEHMPLEDALKETIIIESKIQKLHAALDGKWAQITKLVEEILQQKG